MFFFGCVYIIYVCDIIFHQPPPEGPLAKSKLSVLIEKLESVQIQVAYAVYAHGKEQPVKTFMKNLGGSGYLNVNGTVG